MPVQPLIVPRLPFQVSENRRIFRLNLNTALATGAFGFQALDTPLPFQRLDHSLHRRHFGLKMARQLGERPRPAFLEQIENFGQHQRT